MITRFVGRRTAMTTYSLFCFAGLSGATLEMWKRGLSEPGELLVCAVLVLLSLAFIGITLKAGPGLSPKGTFVSSTCIILFLLVAWDTVRLLRQ